MARLDPAVALLVLVALSALAAAGSQPPQAPTATVTLTLCPAEVALAPGESTDLTGEAYNAGAAPVAMELKATWNASGWSANATPTRASLAARAFRALDVRVTAPANATPGERAALAISLPNGALAPGWAPLVVNATVRPAPGPQPDGSACVRAAFTLPLPPPEPGAASTAAAAALAPGAGGGLAGAPAALALGGGIAAGALLVVWIARSEDRWLRVVAPLAPLFTRLASPEVLRQDVRERVYRAIEQQPGVHFVELRDHLGLSTGVATHHLRMLERHRLVASRREGRYRAYYPVTMRMPAPPSAPLNATAERILEALAREGEVPFADLAARLDVTKSTVSYNVRLLEERGLAELSRRPEDGRWVVRARAPESATAAVRTSS